MSATAMPVHPVALIGDLVASRTTPDRQAVHDQLSRVLISTNQRHLAVHPALITLGDEFQGVYAELGTAVAASFAIRLALADTVEVRFGLGRGEVHTLDADHGIRDGSAFWSARDAIEAAEHRAGHARSRSSRTVYLCPDEPPHQVALVQSTLDCLDFMVGSLSTPSRSILDGLMNQRPQNEMAAALGLSPSAVSQRIRRDGLAVAVGALTSLSALP